MNTEMTTRETELLAANAALEAEVLRLRDVIFDMAGEEPGISWGKADKVLSTPFTPTALNELIEKVERRTIERCAEKLLSIGALGDGDFLAAIRALPNVTLDELL